MLRGSLSMGDIVGLRGLLKRYRQERGLTQDDLAERVGCATQTIRKIEGGQRRPSYQMAARLGHILQLSAEEQAVWMAAVHDTVEQATVTSETIAPAMLTQAQELPVYLTPFVGREQEQAELAAALDSPACRLVTLLGPGGIGKTRLAIEVARQITQFSDGVAFVPLASVAAPQPIMAPMRDALGLTFSGSTQLAAQLLAFLRDKHILLVFDNLEHLLDSGSVTLGLIEQLLTQVPGLKVLVTSRERLKLSAAWVLEVEGLPVPPTNAPQTRSDYAALTLFAQHAQHVQRTFRLDSQTYGAAARICQLVGGVPLGIELAATWLRMLSPEEIGQEIARNLDVEHLSPGTMPLRHHSLRSVVDHSWNLLSLAERQALSRLAVFHGGFTREAAHQIADVSLAVLSNLLDKSLVRRAARGRYELHEIIRQYAEARLREDQVERTSIHDRHCAYYADWLAEREHAILSAQQVATLTAITAEIDNIRAMWQWALTRQRLDALWRGAETLQWFYEFRSWFHEGVALFLQAAETLRHIVQADANAEHQRVIGRILGHYSYLASRLGSVEQAHSAVTQSLAMLRDTSDTVALSHSYMYQGMIATQLGDYDLARLAFRQSLALAQSDAHVTHAICQTWGSLVAYARGDYQEAENLFRVALARCRTLGNQRAIIFCLTFGSIALIALGKHDEAQTLLREGLMLAGAENDRWGMAMALQHLGLVARAQHNLDEAVYLFREALNLLRVTGNRWELARVLNHLGAVLSANGATTEAEHIYRDALGVAFQADAVPDVLQAVTGLAALHVYAQNYAPAFELIVHVQHNPASRIETREQATQLHAILLPHVSQPQIDTITQSVENRSLEGCASRNRVKIPTF